MISSNITVPLTKNINICDPLSENPASLHYSQTPFYDFFVVEREKSMGSLSVSLMWRVLLEL